MIKQSQEDIEKKLQKPKPPQSAFHHYLQEVGLKLKQEDPKLKQSQIAKKVKEMFSDLPDQDMQRYLNLEEKAQKNYKKEKAEYKKKMKAIKKYEKNAQKQEDNKNEIINIKADNSSQAQNIPDHQEQNIVQKDNNEAAQKPIKKKQTQKSTKLANKVNDLSDNYLINQVIFKK